MADGLRASLRLVPLVAMASLAAACMARPVGDFGRAAPSYTHDTAMPANGNYLATNRGEPVSKFNVTDQEVEMHDRVWRFLVAAHARDWGFDRSVELERTRITPPTTDLYETDRYYAWLKETPYQSSRTRYSTVGSHITSDIDTIPTTFAAICAVIAVDRQRAVALAGLGDGLPPEMAADVDARKYENDAFIAWFVLSLNYRYESYDFALDSLLVETPHEQSLAVDEALRRMSVHVERANRHDFCGDGRPTHTGGDVVIPSRYQFPVDVDLLVPK